MSRASFLKRMVFRLKRNNKQRWKRKEEEGRGEEEGKEKREEGKEKRKVGRNIGSWNVLCEGAHKAIDGIGS